jgi:3-oxoacyl-[acyl-carrier protein] reductase
MADLAGKTALITGAASGIGLATAELFAKRGAKVALNYLPGDPRGPAAVERLRTQGLAVIGAPGDVAKAGAAEAMVREAIEALGRLDFLVNNAGTPATIEPIPPSELDRLTEEFWATILATNLLGPFRCTHAAVAALKAAGGAVCNTASVAGRNMPGSSMAYGASKAALINLTQNLARALAPQARVNAGGARLRRYRLDAEMAGSAQPGLDRAHPAQARLHARRYRRRHRVSVRRHQHDHGADPGGGRRLLAMRRRQEGGLTYSARPSKAVGVSVPISTSSRQRTLTATISPPVGVVPRENAPTPHCGQNRW